jgi:hypothetical protein
VLDEERVDAGLTIDHDVACLAQIRHFAGLVPLGQQSRKPLFDLKRADGVSGGGGQLVVEARNAFRALCEVILARLAIDVP